MTGKAQVYEPFLIQPLRRFLQQLDLLLVVFDEVIVGGEDARNAALNWQIREIKFNSAKILYWKLWLCTSSAMLSEERSVIVTF